MKTQQAIEHFDGINKLAAVLNIKAPSIYDWGDEPPPLRQLQIEQITCGELKASNDVFGKPTQRALKVQKS